VIPAYRSPPPAISDCPDDPGTRLHLVDCAVAKQRQLEYQIARLGSCDSWSVSSQIAFLIAVVKKHIPLIVPENGKVIDCTFVFRAKRAFRPEQRLATGSVAIGSRANGRTVAPRQVIEVGGTGRFPPPSEPCVRFSRTRLSSQRVTPRRRLTGRRVDCDKRLDPEHFIKIKTMTTKPCPRTLHDQGKNRVGSRQNWGNQGGDFVGWSPVGFFPVAQ